MKKLTIMGGMLYVMAYVAGPFSIDAERVKSTAARPGSVKRKHKRSGAA